jgi:Ca-activated chloride channel homolog
MHPNLGTGSRSLLILAACSVLLHAQAIIGHHTVGQAFAMPRNCSACSADIRIDCTLVQVPVCVTDRRGGFILGLQRGSFRVFEDGVEQEVSSFSGTDVPVSVGLIFDTSGSMETKLPMARAAVEQFLKTANLEDEFFLLPFDSRPRPVSGFTDSAEAILDEMRRTEANGSTALLDAVYAGLGELKKAHNPQRVLVIISDGEDNHSRHTKREIYDAIRESDAQIFALCIHPLVYSRHGRIRPVGAELLSRLCIDTGGRSFEIDDVHDLPGIARKIGLEIRNEYLLGYRPTNENWDGRYRHITLKLMQSLEFPHLTANWRRGYYAPNGTGR